MRRTRQALETRSSQAPSEMLPTQPTKATATAMATVTATAMILAQLPSRARWIATRLPSDSLVNLMKAHQKGTRARVVHGRVHIHRFVLGSPTISPFHCPRPPHTTLPASYFPSCPDTIRLLQPSRSGSMEAIGAAITPGRYTPCRHCIRGRCTRLSPPTHKHWHDGVNTTTHMSTPHYTFEPPRPGPSSTS